MVERTTDEEGGLREIPPERADTGVVPYKLLTVEEFLELPASAALVRGVLRCGELFVLYGEAACFKTFVALDLALKVACGIQWWGHATTQGSVIYFVGEARSGLRKRLRAWGFEYKIDPKSIDLRLLPHAIALLEQADFDRLLASLSVLPRLPVLIVIDTLARYMIGGDENSTEHMGQFVARCATLQRVTGATVLVIHHKGKGAASERGSSALRGAADVMIDVKRDGFDLTLKGDKAKDDEPLNELRLSTKRVWIGPNSDGDDEHSLVLVAQEDATDSVATVDGLSPHREPSPGDRIRRALALTFDHQPTTGAKLRDASGVKKSTFYDALNAELASGRVEPVPSGPHLKYRLGSNAPESRASSPVSSPVPSPVILPDSDCGESPSVVRRSGSAHPLKGVAPDPDSDSAGATTTPQPDTTRRHRGAGADDRGAE